MKLIKTEMAKLSKKGRYTTDIFETLNEFAQSGFECAKIDDYPHKTAASCAHAFRWAIKKYNRPHIKVTIRQNDVYLINTLIK